MLKKLLVLLLINCFVSTSGHASEIRKESLGDVEGILGMAYAKLKRGEVVINPFAETTGVYEIYARAPVNAGGFESTMPLQVTHSALNNRVCYSLFLDKDHTLEKMKEFAQDYLGSKVRLRNVQAVFSGNKRLHCTFKDFDVLASRDELVMQQEKQIKQKTKSEGQANEFQFEGDLTGTVYKLFPDWARFGAVTEGGMSGKEWEKYCGGRVEIEPALDLEQMQMIRSELKKTRGRAKLENIKVAANKCMLGHIVPVP